MPGYPGHRVIVGAVPVGEIAIVHEALFLQSGLVSWSASRGWPRENSAPCLFVTSVLAMPKAGMIGRKKHVRGRMALSSQGQVPRGKRG